MIKNLIERILFPWHKWEIHEYDVPMIYRQIDHIHGIDYGQIQVLVDIYVREHKFNGLKKYKKVVKK